MRQRADELRREGRRIAVVPTMGALHEGHLSLIDRALELADVAIVTIFVNPKQFGPNEDLASYPRREENDLALASARGAAIGYCPSAEMMYPSGYQTQVEVTEVSKGLCGASRPEHFAGVATIVTKLLAATKAHVAVFGRKDYQQLVLVRRMVADLDLGTEIASAPIFRDDDGLALSSRNRYLSADERVQATVLYRALRDVRERFERGQRNAQDLEAKLVVRIREAPGLELDYAELRSADSLEPIDGEIGDAAIALVAARVGTTRLIDNIELGGAAGDKP